MARPRRRRGARMCAQHALFVKNSGHQAICEPIDALQNVEPNASIAVPELPGAER